MGNGGWSLTISWAQQMKGGAHPSLLLPNPSQIRKRYQFTAGLTKRVFQSSHQTWGNRILYSYLNTIRIHFLSNREVFCIHGFFRIKVFVFVFEYSAKVMYS